MRRILGASCVSCLVGLIGVSAAGLGGYSVMTGKSVCSMLHGCPESAKETTAQKTKEAVVINASNKEGETKKEGGCCALSGLAKKSACSSEAKVVEVSAKEGGCPFAKAACMASKAKPGDVVAVAGTFPVVMPAMYYNPAVQVNEKDLASGGCSEAKSSCCKSAEGQVVQAKATAGESGCCKGSGTRADGQPCKKDGEHCTKGAGEQAEKKPAEAEKTGEPVASRN